MPELPETPPTAAQVEQLDAAIADLRLERDRPDPLLRADVSGLERLDFCVFLYRCRDDVFYLNRAGRRLLLLPESPFAPAAARPAPLFWLEDRPSSLREDQLVLHAGKPLREIRELVTLAWGKTWLEGEKRPVAAPDGPPAALLFAGSEMPPARQIRLVGSLRRPPADCFGDN